MEQQADNRDSGETVTTTAMIMMVESMRTQRVQAQGKEGTALVTRHVPGNQGREKKWVGPVGFRRQL